MSFIAHREEDVRLLEYLPPPPQANYLSEYSLSLQSEQIEMVDRKQEKKTETQTKKPFFSYFYKNKNKSNNGVRLIHINQPQGQKFMSNSISTAKYNPISFLPKFLYVEFSKSANLFFLFISGIQVNKHRSLSA